jgi:hypothetical protein
MTLSDAGTRPCPRRHSRRICLKLDVEIETAERKFNVDASSADAAYLGADTAELAAADKEILKVAGEVLFDRILIEQIGAHRRGRTFASVEEADHQHRH